MSIFSKKTPSDKVQDFVTDINKEAVRLRVAHSEKIREVDLQRKELIKTSEKLNKLKAEAAHINSLLSRIR